MLTYLGAVWKSASVSIQIACSIGDWVVLSAWLKDEMSFQAVKILWG